MVGARLSSSPQSRGTANAGAQPIAASRPPRRTPPQDLEFKTTVGRLSPGVTLHLASEASVGGGGPYVLVPQTPGEIAKATAHLHVLELQINKYNAKAPLGLAAGLGAKALANWITKNPPTEAEVAALMAAVRASGVKGLASVRNVITTGRSTGAFPFAVRVAPFILEVGAVGALFNAAQYESAAFEQRAQINAASIEIGNDRSPINGGLGLGIVGFLPTGSGGDLEDSNETNGPIAPGQTTVIAQPMGGQDP